jgi:hypothetical protein
VTLLPQFTITRQIEARLGTVWDVLDDFGGIQCRDLGIIASALTFGGPIAQGTTRHCRLSLFGGINERIDVHGPNRRLTIHILEAFKLLLSDAVADFNITPNGRGTESTLHYRYTLNRLGRMAKGATDRQLRKGITGLGDGLQRESERVSDRA